MAFNFKKLSILVVDDDPSLREITAAILQKLELSVVHTAVNGEDGFEKFKKHNYSLIITDWQMEPMNGLELIRAIRAPDSGSPNRKVPIILATAYTNSDMIKEARNAGTTELLVKPYSTDDLAKRIAYTMNKPRKFIEIENYAGPDRRRLEEEGYKGQNRRKEDKSHD